MSQSSMFKLLTLGRDNAVLRTNATMRARTVSKRSGKPPIEESLGRNHSSRRNGQRRSISRSSATSFCRGSLDHRHDAGPNRRRQRWPCVYDGTQVGVAG
jgi:hypothetical protein